MPCCTCCSSAPGRLSVLPKSVAAIKDSDVIATIASLQGTKDDPQAFAGVIERISSLYRNRVDAVEVFLPQICYFLLNSGNEQYEALEEFLVRRSASSFHFGLLSFFFLFGAIHDIEAGTPKRTRLTRTLLLVYSASITRSRSKRPIMSETLFASALAEHPDLAFLTFLNRELVGISPQSSPVVSNNNAGGEGTDPSIRCSPRALLKDYDSTLDNMGDEGWMPPDWLGKSATARLRMFHQELYFIDSLTQVSELLRQNQDRSTRSEMLKCELEMLNDRLQDCVTSVYIPTENSKSPFLRVVRIPPGEGHVFSTHTRAPYLVVVEVVESLTSLNRPSTRTRKPAEDDSKWRKGQKAIRTRLRSATDTIKHKSEVIMTEIAARARSATGAEEDGLHSLQAEILSGEVKQAIARTSDMADDTIVPEDEVMPDAAADDIQVEVVERNEEDLGGRVTTQAVQRLADDTADDRRPSDLGTAESEASEDSVFGRENDVGNASSNQDAENEGNQNASNVETSSSGIMVSEPKTPRNKGKSYSLKSPQINEADAMEKDQQMERIMNSIRNEDGPQQSPFGGETWEQRVSRIKSTSPYGGLDGWQLKAYIVKSHDDLRQEVFAMQLIQLFDDIFKAEGVPLYLRPYRVMSTSADTGLVECITDATSIDGLKKRPGFVSMKHHFEMTYGKEGSHGYNEALNRYLSSLAGYSLLTYVLNIKDRHNGNILLDHLGRIIHIDYGFFLTSSPGGISFESAPFKLTKDMNELLGSRRPASPAFQQFVLLLVEGLLALREHSKAIIMLVEHMYEVVGSKFECFKGGNAAIRTIEQRLVLEKSKPEVVRHVAGLVQASFDNGRSSMYDRFQKMTNNIW